MKKIINGRQLIKIGILILIMNICAFIISFHYSLLRSFNIILGSFFVFWLPGFCLTYIFFSCISSNKSEHEQGKEDQSLNWVERALLAPFLSITLLVFELTVIKTFNIKLGSFSAVLVLLFVNQAVILFALFIYKFNQRNKLN